ncbi:hypothetical protein RQP46_005300 [Phenoliferia psychrophenolica]
MFSPRSLLLAAVFGCASVLAAPAPATSTSVAEVSIVPGVLALNPNVLIGGSSLVNLNVFASVLGVANCTNADVVGLRLSLSVLPLVNVCACVQVGAFPLLGTASCPTCPAHSSPACIATNCACQCDYGYYSTVYDGVKKCVPNTGCSLPNTLVQLLTGGSSCVCARGYISDLLGGCISACLVVQ